MRTIILAAGQGFQLDGCVKLLIRDPQSGNRIIDQYIKLFKRSNLTVVVGYKAIEIIQRYPDLTYVYNSEWKITNNSYSLGLALNGDPCYVLSSDLFVSQETIKILKDAKPNCILTENKENRELNSLNCMIKNDNQIAEIYQGPRRNIQDPEAIGIYKISDKNILESWKINCLRYGNLFAGQNLRFDLSFVYSVDKGSYAFNEINTVYDYINLIERYNK